MEEVHHRSSLAQELRIRGDVKQFLRNAVSFNDATNPFVGVDGNGALLNDEFVSLDRSSDLAGDGIDEGKVGAASPALRRSNRNEDHMSLFNSGLQIGREFDVIRMPPAQKFREVLLVNGDAAL